MRFQFQTGSIKSSLTLLIHTPTNSTFQFQTGSIKSLQDLKDVCHVESGMFQFQTGSIKRSSSGLSYYSSTGTFQFQTGSIKSLQPPEPYYECSCVSIPNWFD